MTALSDHLRADADYLDGGSAEVNTNRLREAADEIDRLREALAPFAEPHAMGDNYVQFAPRLIEAARKALNG